jgi:uncharacterized protein Usg
MEYELIDTLKISQYDRKIADHAKLIYNTSDLIDNSINLEIERVKDFTTRVPLYRYFLKIRLLKYQRILLKIMMNQNYSSMPHVPNIDNFIMTFKEPLEGSMNNYIIEKSYINTRFWNECDTFLSLYDVEEMKLDIINKVSDARSFYSLTDLPWDFKLIGG